MQLDISKIPFSRYGSYFAFSWYPHNPKAGTDPGNGGLYLRNIHWGSEKREVFKLSPYNQGEKDNYSVDYSPSVLKLVSDKSVVEICFASASVVRIRGRGTGMRFEECGNAEMLSSVQITETRRLINKFSNKLNVVIDCMKGSISVDEEWNGRTSLKSFEAAILPDDTGEFEAAFELYTDSYRMEIQHGKSFEECVHEVEEEFNLFLRKTISVPEKYSQSHRYAAYLNWSSVVEPCGFLKRYGMYMSKNWMLHVWSWDHCFNAISLSYKAPELAWEQMLSIFDHQSETGALPDDVNDALVHYNFCKPPIHGWALKKMIRNNPWFDKDRKREIYGPLCRWTDWWFQYRDFDRDGIPQYNHGNDSGWDNSTIFRFKLPVESPDLSAFLILQMDVLAEIANELDLNEEAEAWRNRSDALLRKMLKHFWNGSCFSAVVSGEHTEIPSESMILYLPLLLGNKLPVEYREKLIRKLKNSGLLTPFGPATEPAESRLFEENGYWRGPVWAPTTMLLAEGLLLCGEKDLSRGLVQGFADTVDNSGFAENFSALTGKGLCDPAYTWTSSVFLVLAHEYLMEDEPDCRL